MKKLFAVTAAIALLCLGSIAQAVVIDTVPVGNPGNAADGYGSVGYAYEIGKYEVTAGQYAEFLNAVAATDTYGLYSTYMGVPTNYWFGCNILRSGISGAYTYSVASDWANRPVNYVSYWDSCRFANWMHNGQPTGLQTVLTTEDGAYSINGYNGDDGRAIQRNTGARWFVPSEDEWYKAAYYDPDKPGGAGYWDYPTKSNSIPSNALTTPDGGNNANCEQGGFTIGSPYYRTNVGEFENSEGAYNTFDQGGNVCEWNEVISHDAGRGLRGGSYAGTAALHRANRSDYNPTGEFAFVGFRVAYLPGGWQPVPEPSSIIALAGGFGMLLGLRRRKA